MHTWDERIPFMLFSFKKVSHKYLTYGQWLAQNFFKQIVTQTGGFLHMYICRILL